jgi:hypothetical protein
MDPKYYPKGLAELECVENRRIADPKGNCILALESLKPRRKERHKAGVL